MSDYLERPQAALPPLIDAVLNDEDPVVREHAAKALGGRGHRHDPREAMSTEGRRPSRAPAQATTAVGLLLLLLACQAGPRPGENCTIVYASDGRVALAGNNEDAQDDLPHIQFLPAERGKLGRVYFGFDVANFPQGGVNEAGLFFDAAAVDRTIVVPRNPAKPAVAGQLILKAMEECTSVDDVVRLFQTYDFSGRMSGFYLVGDRFGNSAIIEPDTIIRKQGWYQIGTSAAFPSDVASGRAAGYRHQVATAQLEETGALSVDRMRRVLSATHWEESRTSRTTTLYSYIADLANSVLYIYNFHDFETVARIDLREELARGGRIQPIRSLFPHETFAERRYRAEVGAETR